MTYSDLCDVHVINLLFWYSTYTLFFIDSTFTLLTPAILTLYHLIYHFLCIHISSIIYINIYIFNIYHKYFFTENNLI